MVSRKDKQTPYRGPTGRKKPDGKTEYIGFRASKSERVYIEGMANNAGLTPSAFIRSAAMGATVTPRKDNDKLTNDVVYQLRAMGNNLNQILVEARRRNFPDAVAVKALEAIKSIKEYSDTVFHDR